MLTWGSMKKHEEGQAIVEFAVLLPVFAFVAFMVVDIQWMTKDAANLDYIVTEAARCEAMNGPACTAGTNTVQGFASILAQDLRLNSGQFSIQAPACGQTCVVTATYDYKPLGAWFPKIQINRTGRAAVTP